MPSIISDNHNMKPWFSVFESFYSKRKINNAKTFNLIDEKEVSGSLNKYAETNQKTTQHVVSKKTLKKTLSDSSICLSRSNSCLQPKYNNNNNALQSHLPFSSSYIHHNDQEVVQHYILRTAFGSDFSESIIPLQRDQPKLTVIDMGCGYGTWTMEMATQFPCSNFIGMDRYPNFPSDIKPKNCHFKTFLISQKKVQLPFLDNSIDYIFQRDLNWDLTEDSWLELVEEYFRILKPGGWVEIVEPDFITHSGLSHEDLLINKLINVFSQKNQDPFMSLRLSSLMAMSGFRRIQSDFQSIPLGWGHQKLCQSKKKEGSICSEFARVAACQRLDLWKSLQPWFIRENHFSKSKYETFIQELPDQWFQNKAYINWHRSTAQKPYPSNYIQ